MKCRKEDGFTLVEMAIALIVFSAISLGIFLMTSSVMSINKQNTDEANMLSEVNLFETTVESKFRTSSQNLEATWINDNVLEIYDVEDDVVIEKFIFNEDFTEVTYNGNVKVSRFNNVNITAFTDPEKTGKLTLVADFISDVPGVNFFSIVLHTR